jgi:hypothetical protein
VDGWAVAVQVFPDSILEEVRARIAAETKKKKAGGGAPQQQPAAGEEGEEDEGGAGREEEPESAWDSAEAEAEAADW